MLPKDYQDMLFALSEQQVDFIIVGACALAAHRLGLGLPTAAALGGPRCGLRGFEGVRPAGP